MENKICYIFLFILTVLLSGCIEDPDFTGEMKGGGKPVFKSGATYIAKTASSVKFSAEIIKENGYQITERGFVWSTSSNPAIENGNKIKDITGTGIGIYTFELKGLNGNTSYYIRPYAINEKGTEYGSPELVIITNPGLGTVINTGSFPKAEDIHAASAKAGGTIVDAGEGEIIKRGIYYSLSKVFLIKDSILSADDSNIYVCQLTGLSPATTYYYKAFVTNTFGTFESATADSLTTKDGLALISNVEVEKRDYNEVTLKSGAFNSNDPTVQIIERGFCWGVEPALTIANDTVRANPGNGVFQCVIRNLTAGKQYYARAYAKTEYGVVYSDPNTFKTEQDLPSVRTEDADKLQSGKVDLACTVTDKGKSEIISAGICWSLSNKTPTLSDNKEELILKLFLRYEGRMSKLRGGNTYYIRAYATNTQGTSYGEVKQFSTPPVFTTGLATFEGGDLLQKSNAYFSINDNLYIMGGDHGNSYSNELWSYSISSGRWLKYKALPFDTAKWQVGVAYGLGAFVFGGLKEDGNESDKLSFYDYSDNANIWRSHAAGPLSIHSAVAFAPGTGSSIYIVGGKQGDTVKNTVWNYDMATKAWTQKPDFPAYQYGGVAIILNGLTYVGMGKDDTGRCNGYLWVTQDNANTWRRRIFCPVFAGGIFGGVACGENIYIIDETYRILEFDTAEQSWREKNTLPIAYRKFNCIYENNGKIYIGLGANNSLLVYEPVWDN